MIFVARRLAVLMAVVAQTALKIATLLVVLMVVAVTTALISFLTIGFVAVHKKSHHVFRCAWYSLGASSNIVVKYY